MRKDWDLTEEDFNRFLSWLDPDREEAGKKYEAIRRHLIIILTCRGCPEAEDLADETINRVIRHYPKMADTYQGEPAPYFITVSYNLYLEYVAKRGRQLVVPPPPEPDPEEEREYECLDACIEKLTPAHRDLVLQYYQENKQAKIDHRKKLALEMGIELNALRIRAHRIRVSLQQCIDECLTSGPLHEMDRA